MDESISDAPEYQPVVIDNGSGMIKAGIAGEEKPSVVFNSYVGIPKHKKVMTTAIDTDVYVGKIADDFRGVLKLSYALEHGIVKSWTDMEHIWRHTFESLKTNTKEHPVLITEAPLNPLSNREKAAEIMFETFGVPSLFFATQAVLSLYSSGRLTGTVLDIGDGVSHCVPIYDGFVVPHTISRIDLGGRDITERLRMLLRRTGHNFHTSAEFEIVKKIKEKLCYFSNIYPASDDCLALDDKKNVTEYMLPDGTSIKLGWEKQLAPEILFTPDKYGLPLSGVHEMVVNSVCKADNNLRKTLYSSIVLSGGSTLFNGFGDRCLNDIKKLASKDMKIVIYALPDRQFSCWLGGSLLSSLSSFNSMWVSKKEYDEEGSRILHTRSL